MKKLLLTIAILAIAAPVMANATLDGKPDLTTWVGGNSTHQYWDFTPNHVGAIGGGWNAEPDELEPVGFDTFATIEGTAVTYDPLATTFSGTLLDVALKIDNFENPSGYKLIWVDLGYTGQLTTGVISAHDGGVLSFDYELLPGQGDADFGVLIVPNPDWEEIHFMIAGPDATLDWIHVDTVCIPAPGALLLGSMGMGLVGWLRRRRTL